MVEGGGAWGSGAADFGSAAAAGRSKRGNGANGAEPATATPPSKADEICTRATAMHKGRRFERQASGVWLSAGGEGYELRIDQTTGAINAFDKAGAIVPPLVDDLDLHPVNFGRLRLKAEEQKPRGWLLGNWICRQFISSLIADGATGKTILRLLCALKIALGHRTFSLAGLPWDILPSLHLFERVPVLFLCFEDSEEELYRRLLAAMKHYEISNADIEGYLYVQAITDARMKLVLEDEFRQRRVGPLKAALERTIDKINDPETRGQRPRLGAVFLDPLIKTHGVGENDNTAMDLVMQILSGLAIDHDLAVDVPQHTSKGMAEPGNADRGRGASATKDAGRLYYTLCNMSDKDAADLGIDADQQIDLMRVDSGKVKTTRKNKNTLWFRRIPVKLGNTWNPIYPNGDEIVTVEEWSPPDPLADFTEDLKLAVFKQIRTGPGGGRRYLKARNSEDWVGHVIMQITGKLEGPAAAIVEDWCKKEILIPDPVPQSRRVSALVVNELKAHEILGSLYEPPEPPKPKTDADKAKAPKAKSGPKLPPSEYLARKALKDTLTAQAVDAISVDQWRAAAMVGGFKAAFSSNPEKAFADAARKLIRNSLVVAQDDSVSLHPVFGKWIDSPESTEPSTTP